MRDEDEAQRVADTAAAAADVMFSGPETYIFPANAEGKIVNWGELDGSYKGGLNHERALRQTGFEVAVSNPA